LHPYSYPPAFLDRQLSWVW